MGAATWKASVIFSVNESPIECEVVKFVKAKKPEMKEFLEQLGALAEIHLAYYRACLGAGATQIEAMALTSACMKALFEDARERGCNEETD